MVVVRSWFISPHNEKENIKHAPNSTKKKKLTIILFLIFQALLCLWSVMTHAEVVLGFSAYGKKNILISNIPVGS